MPVDLLFKKIAILYIVNNLNNWINLNEISNKRKTVAHDTKVIYFKKSFGHRLVDYLGPAYFNYMSVTTRKKTIICKYSNAKMAVIKWLLMSLD